MKKKPANSSLWEHNRRIIIIFILIAIFGYILIYRGFVGEGIFFVGFDLKKSDWLSFLGAYLSFAGTVVVSLIAILQSHYYTTMEAKKEIEKRKKEIQPIFSVKISGVDTLPKGIEETIDLLSAKRPNRHKNVEITIENVGPYPVKHLIVFGKYTIPLFKSNEIQYVHCAYSDSDSVRGWEEKFIVLLESDYERNENWIPKWFNINYEDIDGEDHFQTFVLKEFDGTLYYALDSINDI